tara:strand:- start:29 stop:247 length:219 start_codon:yes stop_codon:yes gene_type:complete
MSHEYDGSKAKSDYWNYENPSLRAEIVMLKKEIELHKIDNHHLTDAYYKVLNRNTELSKQNETLKKQLNIQE